MTVTIYIWYPAFAKSSFLSAVTFTNVGHVAMQINDTYISHRPSLREDNSRTYLFQYILEFLSKDLTVYGDEKEFGIESVNYRDNTKDYTKKYVNLEAVESADSTNYSYESECKLKKRKADEVISIDGLDEKVMLQYYLKNKRVKYHAFSMNCSTFIANIIRSSLGCSGKLCSFCSFRYNSFNIDENDSQFLILGYIFSHLSLIFIGGVSLLSFLSHFGILALTGNDFLNKKVVNHLIKSGISLLNFPVWTPTLIKAFLKKINKSEQSKVCLT